MFRWTLPALLLALFVWPTTASAQGNTDDAKRIEALEYRLKALEDQNRQLMEELRSMRAAAPAAAPVTAAKKDKGVSAYWKDALKFKTEDDTLDAHLGGRVIMHNRTFTSENRNVDSFYAKEIALHAQATLYKDYEFELLGGFVPGGANLIDGWFRWKRLSELNLRVGQFKMPFSEETLRSALYGDFVENSPMSRLVHGRDLGLELGGETWEKRLEYQVAVCNGRGTTQPDTNDAKDVFVRLVLKPFAPSDDKWLKGIRLGGAFNYGEEKQAFGSISDPSSGTSFLNVAGAGVRNRQERIRWNVEGAWLAGPFKLQGEATWMDLNLARGATAGTTGTAFEDQIDFTSWYITGLWTATGEDATLGRRKPAKNFLSDDGGIGLIELAIRFSQFSVDDDIFEQGYFNDATSTDGYDQYTFGVNWWFNPNVRMYLNYFHNDYWEDISINSHLESDENGFLTRFAIDF